MGFDEEYQNDHDECRHEIERLRMEYGRQQARNAVFMHAMAHLARNGMQDDARKWIESADQAAANVRPEDFVTLTLNTAREAGGEE